MRITKDTVRQLADYAEELTNGEFGLQDVGTDLGSGTRYMNRRNNAIWLGREGARKAAAYYAGVIDMAHEGEAGDRPEGIQAVIRFLVGWRESAVRAGAEDFNLWRQSRELGARNR